MVRGEPQRSLGAKSGFDSWKFVGILSEMKSLSDYSASELRGAIALREQIEVLQGQIEELTGDVASEIAAGATEAPAPAKRRLSASHRRKLLKALAKARKVRWAKAKAAGTAPSPRKRRRMSAAGRAAIGAAAKARWAKFRAEKS
jgi:hypothetical protein